MTRIDWPEWAKGRAVADLSNGEISKVAAHLIGDEEVWTSLEARMVKGWAKMEQAIESLNTENRALAGRLQSTKALLDGQREYERQNLKLVEIVKTFEKCCGISRNELVRRAKKTAKLHRETIKNLRETVEILQGLNRKQLIESRQQEFLTALKA